MVIYPVDSAIGFPNTFPLDGDLSSEYIVRLVSQILIRWIVIYPVDRAIQRLNNRGLEPKNLRISDGVWGGLFSLTAVTFSSSAGLIPCLRKQ